MKKVSLAVITALSLNSFIIAGPKERAGFALWRWARAGRVAAARSGARFAKPAFEATEAVAMPALTVVTAARTMAAKGDRKDDHPAFRWGIDHGWIDPTARLQQLAIFGSARELEISLEKGGDPNFAPNLPGKTPLQWVAETGDMEKAKILLAAGAEVDALNKQGESALSIAAEGRHLDFVKFLLEDHDADANLPTPEGETLLHKSARENTLHLAKILFIYGGAEVDAKDEKDLSVSFVAWKNGNLDFLDYLLLIAKANANATDAKGRTLLHLAARAGDLRTVENALAAGADIRARDAKGRFAMHYAVPKSKDSLGTIRSKELIYGRLLAAGAPRNPKDGEGVTPFKMAMIDPASSRARIRLLEKVGICGPGIRGLIIKTAREENLRQRAAASDKDEK